MPASSALAWCRRHAPALALAVVAALVAWAARHVLFPALSWNRDEPVYLWHVEVLRSGHLTATDGGHPGLFQPWLSARGDGVLFTQYTLGWPLVLLGADVLTGSAGTALALGAALAVLGTYAFALELTGERALSTLTAGLLVLSPLLAIQGGAYLSYLFTLGVGLGFGVALLRAIRLHRPRLAVLAGVAVGWIFLTRPYDAILWGAAFVAIALVRHRPSWRPVLRATLLTGVAALPLVLAALAYNRHVTGSFTQFPITAADPLDTFGFGRRRLMPGFETVDYNIAKALRGTAKNVFFLVWFLAGSYVGVVAAGIGAWQIRRERTLRFAVLAVGLVFPVGYFVFWGTWLSSMAARVSGPIYLVPAFAPLCLLMARGLQGTWRSSRRLGGALAALLVVGTVPFGVSRAALNREISREQEPWRTSLDGLEGPALVIVADTSPYLLFVNPFGANPPDLDGDILFAADNGPAVLDLLAEQPDRTPYVQLASVAAPELGPREDPLELDVELVPAEVVRGRTVELVATSTLQGRFTLLQVEGVGVDARAEPASAGVPTTFTLDPAALPARGELTLTVGVGVDRADAAAHPMLRHEIAYRVVDGRIEVLTPTLLARYEQIEQSLQWRHARDAVGLSLSVRGDG